MGPAQSGETMHNDRQRSRPWVVWGLVAYALAVGVVLIAPVSYSGIVHAISAWGGEVFGLTWFGSGWVEFAANIVMFAPLGFLLTLLWQRRAVGVLVAVGLSVAAELVQAVIPSREPSLRDILANTLGAGMGAIIAWLLVLRRAQARRRAEPAGREVTGAV